MKDLRFLIVLIFTVLAGMMLPGTAYASFAHSAIPPALLQNANCVYRINSMEVVLHDVKSFTIKREIAITILNENGRGADRIYIPYSSTMNAKFLGGAIYDQHGKEIRKIRTRDLFDTSNFNDFSLYEDNRILIFEPRVSSYPYTVHYSFEQTYSRGLYHSYPFYPHGGYNIGVEKAALRVSSPAAVEVKYLEINNMPDVRKTIEGNQGVVLEWSFSQLPVLEREYLSPGFRNVAPGILIAANHFEYDGFRGQSDTWQNFGLWQWRLNQGMDQLPAARVGFIREMVKEIENPRDKVKAIYEYMQSRTRYVSVQLGLGGLQPFDATTTDRVGYGDCKALTNYMMAMLKAAGIQSYYTLVRAGENEYSIIEDFPVFQFNHAILCVPIEGDTIWLECTSQNAPFGYLGDFTDSRPVLLIREDGGHLVRTYGYDSKSNVLITSGMLALDYTGNANGKLSFMMGGIHYSSNARALRMSPDDQKKWLYSQYTFPNYTIRDYTLSASTENNPVVEISMDVSFRSFGNSSGNRLFLPLNNITSMRRTPPRVRNRTQPFVMHVPVVQLDTLVITIPSGFIPESDFPVYDLETEFGQYKVNIQLEDNKLIIIRKLELFRGHFEPEKYQDFFRFFQSITRADNQSLIFVRR